MALSGRRRAAARLSQSGTARMLLLVVGLVPLLLAGCSAQQADAVPLAKNQVFIWPLQQEAKIAYDEMLDPASVTSAYDLGTINMLYVGLVRLDANLNVVPDAAKAMPDISADGLTYTFRLRPNMQFSDGQPLNAQDFAYSMDRALDPHLCVGSVYKTDKTTAKCSKIGRAYLNFIRGAGARISGKSASMIAQGDVSNDTSKGLFVLDPLTIKIQLGAPTPYFLQALTYPTSFAVEKSLIEKYPADAWVDHLSEGGCSGPFMVKSYGGGTQMTMIPNPNWEAAWGDAFKITLDSVVRPLVKSLDDEYSNYLKGEYDYTDVPANLYSMAKSQRDLFETPTLSTNYFGLNWTQPPFDQLAVRQAFALALNKQFLIQEAEPGGAAIPTNHIVPQGMPGFFPGLLTPPPDRTQSITGSVKPALDLLNQARATCPSFISKFDAKHQYCNYIRTTDPAPIVIHTNSDATPKALAKAAADQWNAVLGLNVQIQPEDFQTQLIPGVYATDDAGAPTPSLYQAWNIGWLADYADPQDFLSLQFGPVDQGNNATWAQDDTLNKLFAAAEGTDANDPVKRMQDYNQSEQRAIDVVAWLPYQQGKLFWRERSWVQNFGLNALWLMPDVKWHQVSILQH
jgi:peptide/nickel transport system substrate-binding protein/oligopeptide transport system substrate-binding protein